MVHFAEMSVDSDVPINVGVDPTRKWTYVVIFGDRIKVILPDDPLLWLGEANVKKLKKADEEMNEMRYGFLELRYDRSTS